VSRHLGKGMARGKALAAMSAISAETTSGRTGRRGPSWIDATTPWTGLSGRRSGSGIATISLHRLAGAWRPLGKRARKLVRQYGLKPRHASEEFFKLCLDMGLSLSVGLSIMRSVKQAR